MPFFFALATQCAQSHPYGAGSQFPNLFVILKKLPSEVSELERLRYQTYACAYFFRMP